MLFVQYEATPLIISVPTLIANIGPMQKLIFQDYFVSKISTGKKNLYGSVLPSGPHVEDMPSVTNLSKQMWKLQLNCFTPLKIVKRLGFSLIFKTSANSFLLWRTNVRSNIFKSTLWRLQFFQSTAKAFKILSTKWACWLSQSPTDTVSHLHLSLYTVIADSDKIISYWTPPASG